MEKIIFINPLTKVAGQFFTDEELESYSQIERNTYEHHLKCHRDLKNVVDTAYEDGLKFGRKIAIAIELISIGLSIEQITKITGLTKEEIEINC